MTTAVDLEGSFVGSVLVVQHDAETGLWHALCECNETFLASADDLASGRADSCGCGSPRQRGRGSWPKTTVSSLPSPGTLGGLCSQYPPEMFHPDQGGRAAAAEAKKVCLQCSIRVQCLAWALDIGDAHAILGGTTADERKALHRNRGTRPKATPSCGSCGSEDHGYVDCTAPEESGAA